MPPLPEQPPSGLARIVQESPAPFWIITTVLTVGVLCLASWGTTRLQRRYKPKVHAWVDRLNDPYTVGPRRGTRFSLLFDESHTVVGVRYKPDGDWHGEPVRPPPASWGARSASESPTFGAWMPMPPHAGSVSDWAADYERRLQAQREARTQCAAWALYRAVWGTPPKGVCRVRGGQERLEDWESVESEEKEPRRVFVGALFATWNGHTRRFRERVVPRRKSLADAIAMSGGESPEASPRLATPALEDDSRSEDGLYSPDMECPSPTPGSTDYSPHGLTSVALSAQPELLELPPPTKARVKNNLVRPSCGKI